MADPDTITAHLTRGAARILVAALFRRAGIESADLDARLLVCAACGIDHLALTADPAASLGPAANVLAAHAARRLAHEPVSRILGRREFWGLPFAIGPAVLDPRPDTEGLVASVLDGIGGRCADALTLLDLGVGSGAILCALLHELPAATGIGTDRSFTACRQAHANLTALGLAGRGTIVCCEWGEPLHGRFDVVVSNPPYIRRDDLAGLEPEVRCFDPVAALDGGADGLDPYRVIGARLDNLLAPGGVTAFECGFDQAEPVARIMREAGLNGIMKYKDLAGHDRVVLGVGPCAKELEKSSRR